MDNWICINELSDRYAGRLNPKYKYINKIGEVMFIISIITGLICLVMTKTNDWFHIGFERKIIVFIVLNIITQMCFFISAAIMFFYWFWHIALQAMEGIKQAVFIVLLPILMIMTIIIIPKNYIPAVSINGDLTEDLSYAWDCMSDKGTTKNAEIVLDDCNFGEKENLYGYISIRNETIILPYNDYLKIMDNRHSILLCQYNYTTKIITQYEIDDGAV